MKKTLRSSNDVIDIEDLATVSDLDVDRIGALLGLKVPKPSPYRLRDKSPRERAAAKPGNRSF